MKHIQIIALFILSIYTTEISTQQDKNTFVEISTWSLIQFIPSPAFYQDKNDNSSRLQFGLKWNITPLSYSFNANKLVSPVQFFKVNPVRRYGGSLELFIQPEWVTAGYKYSNIKRFGLNQGIRAYIPLIEYGEYLAGSLALKYSLMKYKNDDNYNFAGVELGIYTFYGIAGLTFTYNFANESRYNFTFSLRYY